MKVRTISLCISTALLISFSTSTVFADVSLVPTRGDLFESDTILWNEQGINLCPDASEPTCLDSDYYSYLTGSTNISNVFASNGTELAVSHRIDPDFEIIQEPSIYFRVDENDEVLATNFNDEDYLLSTYAYTNGGYNNQPNPVTFVFHDTGVPICGFGTQIAPAETGGFEANIQAFDGNGELGDRFEVVGSDGGEAPFIGLSSTTPMTSVEIVITDTAGSNTGLAGSWYAINQVTLTYCVDLPVPKVPALTCPGFAAPMANYPIKAKKNRVFPLKMELFDEYGFAQSNVELVAAPVVTLTFSSDVDDSGFDANDLLSAGHGSDGNQFDFTDDDIWQFNLKSKGLAPGTYTVTVDSGDIEEYVIDSTCLTRFVIK